MTHPPSGPSTPTPPPGPSRHNGAATLFTPRPSGPATPPPMPPPPAPAPGRLPTLGQVIRDAERLGAQLLAVLQRQWDPASGPQQDGGVLPSEVDMMFGAARTEIRMALLHLQDAAALPLPPAGSAVKLPARGCTSCGSTGAHAPWCISTDDLLAVAASVTEDER